MFNLQTTEDVEDKLTCIKACTTSLMNLTHSKINTNPISVELRARKFRKGGGQSVIW